MWMLALLWSLAAAAGVGGSLLAPPLSAGGLLLDWKPVGPIGTLGYVLACERTREAAIVDCGGDPEVLMGLVRQHNLTLTKVLITHEHFDHTAGVGGLQGPDGAPVPIYLHSKGLESYSRVHEQMETRMGITIERLPAPSRLVEDGDVIKVGQLALEVIHTPGHSPGHVWYVEADEVGVVLGGDLILGHSVGRTDLPGSNVFHLETSIRKVFRRVEPHATIFSGHADPQTLAEAAEGNPYIARELMKDRARRSEL